MTRRLLIVEDDDFLAEAVAERLEEKGWRVAHAKTLNDAVNLAPGRDVVLCDWDLRPFDPTPGDQIVAACQTVNPDARYIIWSGLGRDVPPGVEFMLKDALPEIIESIDAGTL